VGRKTLFFELHQELGARIVDSAAGTCRFQYSSQIGEHHAVRRASGVFDVSHMSLWISKVRAYANSFSTCLANDVGS